jgi:(1->4)-alpha-D-glucan 1-alpha-D-glucosylmutase
VCDTYQGDETWFLSLTDPDVRRPQDWEGRRRQLQQVGAAALPTGPTAKLHVLHRALALRARRPDAFEAPYRPVEAGRRTLAHLRGDDVLVVAPLAPDPEAMVAVPSGTWRSALHAVQRSFDGPTPVQRLVDGVGVGLWERIA